MQFYLKNSFRLSATSILILFTWLNAPVSASVFVHNTTKQIIEVHCQGWTTRSGTSIDEQLTWTIQPGVRTRLTKADLDLDFSRFRWRTATSAGSTPEAGREWVANVGADGHINVIVRNAELPPPSGEVVIRNAFDFPLKITRLSYVDIHGRKHTTNSWWSFAPGEKGAIVINEKRIRARRVDLTFDWNGRETSWYWEDADAGDAVLNVVANRECVAPFTRWTHSVEPGRTMTEYSFTAVDKWQTLVFRLENLSNAGDVDLYVYDKNNKIIAKSMYSGTATDRCMIHVKGQEQFRVVIFADKPTVKTSFKLHIAEIHHTDIFSEVAGNEVGKATLGVVLVGLLGDEDDMDRYLKSIGNEAATDIAALGILEGLMELQRQNPSLDPLGAEFIQLAKGVRGRDDKFINIRSAFVDRLVARIRNASIESP